jgi:hypothetical protein
MGAEEALEQHRRAREAELALYGPEQRRAVTAQHNLQKRAVAPDDACSACGLAHVT